MKVTLNDPNRLVIESRPWWPGLLASIFIVLGLGLILGAVDDPPPLWIGLLFTGLGIIAFFAFVERVQVIFDRPNGTIDMRRKTPRGHSKIIHDLSDLSHAEVETYDDTHRCVLVLDRGMSAGRHPVTKAYMSGVGAEQLTEAINAWHTRPGDA